MTDYPSCIIHNNNKNIINIIIIIIIIIIITPRPGLQVMPKESLMPTMLLNKYMLNNADA